MKYLVAAAVTAAAISAAAPAVAATTPGSMDFIGGPYNTAGVSITGYQAYTLVNSKSTVTAADSTLAKSSAYLYDQGIGISNSNYDAAGTTEHTIDNKGGYDFFLLEFSQAVQLTGMTINAFQLPSTSGPDKDAWISYTNLDYRTATDSALLTSLLTSTSKKDYVSNAGANGTFPSFANTFAKTWVIGAALTPSERNDGFKLAGITYNVQTAVPEPASWMTMILGFGVIGGALRRRRTATLATA